MALTKLTKPRARWATFKLKVAQAVSRALYDKVAEMSTSIKDFGAKVDGKTDDSVAIMAAIDLMSNMGGGIVLVPEGTTLVGGAYNSNGYIDIKPKVKLKGTGASLIKSIEGGKSSNSVLVHIKDYASIEDIELQGSDYFGQSGGANYIGWNKVAISSQGAQTGKGIKVSRVGFSNFHYSCVYFHNNQEHLSVTDCYTFGAQKSHYIDIDSNGLIVGNEQVKDDAKLLAGTQVYALTNFYNCGANVKHVTISDIHAVNINDSIVAVNAGGSLHSISNITSSKESAYEGGFCIDLFEGNDNTVSNITAQGHSWTYHIYNGHRNVINAGTGASLAGALVEQSSSFNTFIGSNLTVRAGAGSWQRGVITLDTGAHNNTFIGVTLDGKNSNIPLVFSAHASNYANTFVAPVMANAAVGYDCIAGAESSCVFSHPIFSLVTTRWSKQPVLNTLTEISGISAVAAPAKNVGGTVDVPANTTSVNVSFSPHELSTGYGIVYGTEAANNNPRTTSKTTAGFTITVDTSPYPRKVTWVLVKLL